MEQEAVMNAGKKWMEKLDSLSVIICTLLTYVLYEVTNAPGLFWGDGGEFLAASSTLGIGHAYGHPLFWLVGRLSTLFHPGNPEAAMAHFTAVISAATCGIVALLVRDWCREGYSPLDRAVIIFSVTGLYATATTVWTQATFIEVYNFQAFFIALGLYFLNRFVMYEDHVTTLFVSVYFWGLSITLGLYVVLLFVLPVMLFWRVRSRLRVPLKHLLVSAFFVLLGMSIWIYLPVRSGVETVFYWEKIKSAGDLINYLGRKEFIIHEVAGTSGWMISLSETLKIILMNISLWGVLIIIFSLWSILSDKKNHLGIPYLISAFFLIVFFALFMPLNLNYRQMVDMDVYFIPALILFPPILALGTGKLMKLLKKPLRPLVILPVFIIVWSRFGEIDVSDKQTIQTFTDYLTSNLPKRARVIPVSDEVLHPLLYHLYAAGHVDDFALYKGKEIDFDHILINRPPECPGVFVEINDYFLINLFPQDDYVLSGPFLAPVQDSASSQQLETIFQERFSPENMGIEDLNRLDRFSLARIWSRRGVYWFHEYLKIVGSGGEGHQVQQRAADAFRKAVDLDNFSLEGSLHASNLALSLLRLGDIGQAEHYAQQAIRLNANSPDAHNAFYSVTVRQKDYSRALYHLKKLARFDPKDGEIHLNMALMYALLNQPSEAKEAYQKGIDLGAEHRDRLRSAIFQ